MGGIQGMFLAQYAVLRKNGHSPSEGKLIVLFHQIQT